MFTIIVKKYIWPFVVLGMIALGILVYYPTVQKPIPPGGDSAIYLFDADWIILNQKVLAPYQPTLHGFAAYPSPMTDINLVSFFHLLHLPVLYPLISFYQLLLVVILMMSCYLVGKKYSPLVGVLYSIFTVTSFTVSRLFIGSTVSNLLGFAFINFVMYFLLEYSQTKKRRFIVMIVLVAYIHYLTHGYLSAPLFYPVLILFSILTLLTGRNRYKIKAIIIKFRLLQWAILFIILGSLAVALFPYYSRIIQEGMNSFYQVTSEDTFRRPIALNAFPSFLGYEQLALGLVGCVLFLSQSKNRRYPHLLFIAWPLFLFFLTLGYKIGFSFFYERIVFLMGPSLSFFAAYAVYSLLKKVKSSLKTFTLTLLFIFIVVSGVLRIEKLYTASNLVRPTHIEALRIAKQVTSPKSVIASHVNSTSQTLHDVMIADRDMIYYPVQKSKCSSGNFGCVAFTSPGFSASAKELLRLNITTIVILKPSYDGDEFTSQLIKKYSSSRYYKSQYLQNDAAVFTIASTY